jgi:hypothetical protein
MICIIPPRPPPPGGIMGRGWGHPAGLARVTRFRSKRTEARVIVDVPANGKNPTDIL